MYKKILLLIIAIVCGCEENKNSSKQTDDQTQVIFGCMDSDATNYDQNATIDDGSCEYPPADIVGIETEMSWNWYGTDAVLEYRLENTGGTTAYNVRYRLKYSFKCSGQITGATTTEYSDFITCCEILPGETVNLDYQITGLCNSNGGLSQFTFEVYQIVWN